MALLPMGIYDQLALAVVVAGLAAVFLTRFPKAYSLGLLMLATFGVDAMAQLAGAPPLAAELGFRPWDTARGAWWMPLTSIFVHADLMHMVGNIFILLTAGPALEERAGVRTFLVIYFAAGAAAVVAHALLAYTVPFVSPRTTAVGASGAIFGILTAFAVRYPRERLPMMLFLFVSWLPAFVVLLIYLAFNLAYMLATSVGVPLATAWWAHFAGFLVGLAWAYRLPPAPHAYGGPMPAQALPDPEKLAALATTRELQEILERIRQFSPERVTRDDAQYAEAWLDRFFAKARCPEGHAFRREGFVATCSGGETRVEFGRAPPQRRTLSR